MLLTVYQIYILDCLKEISYIRQRQLCWLMRLKFGSSEEQVNRDLRQLRYLGRIVTYGDNGGFVALPERKRDLVLLQAVDIMIEICGNTLPELMCGEPPCKLSFYIRDERGYLDFKVVPVPMDEELYILTKLSKRYAGFKCTYLFLPESEAQIPRLVPENPAYYVFQNHDGGYRFLKKQR